jgi:hypothetical protein
MDEITHVPKKILVNGKEKVVYVRTEKTERELDHYRMGFFAGVNPLPLNLFGDKLKEKHLVVTAHYETAKKVIRTRLGLDRRPHKVLTGTTLLQQYFFDNKECRGGFPVFKQLYLLFGYSEVTNRRLHEIVAETLFTRHHAEDHFWFVIPKTLEVMAAQWGESLLNLKEFPQLIFDGTELDSSSSVEANPVSTANPTTTTAVGKPVSSPMYRDSSYPEAADEFGAEVLPLPEDPVEARRQKRDREKWRRKLYE